MGWGWVGVVAAALGGLAVAPKGLRVMWRFVKGIIQFGDAIPMLGELPAKVDRLAVDVTHLHDCLHAHAEREELTLRRLEVGQKALGEKLDEHLAGGDERSAR